MTQAQMNVDEFDMLNDVPETSIAFKNFGKLTITLVPKVWRDGKTVEVSKDEWAKTPQKNSEGKGAKQIDAVFAVDVQEFKPQLGFSYTRNVTVGSMDWNKIVAPSIEAATTKGSMSQANRNATLRGLNGKYVAVEDTEQTPRKNADPNAKKYNTVKFVKVYDTREACYADAEKAGALKVSSDNGANSGFGETTPQDPNVPEGYPDAESWKAVKPDVQMAVLKAETPLIEALNKANAKLPKPVQKSKLEAEMPSIHAQAYVEAAKQLNAAWDMTTVSAMHVKKLIEG